MALAETDLDLKVEMGYKLREFITDCRFYKNRCQYRYVSCQTVTLICVWHDVMSRTTAKKEV